MRWREFGSDSWTICLYLCGSNLESRQSWGTKTLDEICDAKIPQNTNVVIQAGGAKTWHSEDVATNGARFVVSDHKLERVGDVGDVSMGEAFTLEDFLAFCTENYPADHVAVVFWDHGGGPLRGACYDETQKFDALSLDEMNEALTKGVEGRGGKPYDIVGYDACLMGSLETAAMLSDDALLMVASEEIEAGAGWDYTALFDALRHLVFGTRYAEFFGGFTKEEGRSNLVDLKGMAEGNVEGSADGGAAWNAVIQAVDEAVTHRVCGSVTTGANGLSLWYPQAFDEEDLAKYVKASPLVSYAKTLEKLYGESMGKVKFSDAGSVTDEGRVSVTIDASAANEFFDLYVVNRALNGSYQDTNVDMTDRRTRSATSWGRSLRRCSASSFLPGRTFRTSTPITWGQSQCSWRFLPGLGRGLLPYGDQYAF